MGGGGAAAATTTTGLLVDEITVAPDICWETIISGMCADAVADAAADDDEVDGC